MPRLTSRGATAIAAVLACFIYANAVRNGWAGDDPLTIRDNLRVHSIHSALSAWFLSYWPPPWQGAGLYRPLAVLSYGVEWTLGGGRPWIFHVTNVLLHALATGLVVRIALAWLPPVGALATGALFAVHPVHVEAVSNVVGRLELLVAVGLLAAVLAARRYRHDPDDKHARIWLGVTLAAVGFALFSKEHGVIAIAVIAVDHALDPEPARRRLSSLYVGVGALTLGWFHLWRAIAGIYVSAGATTAFYGLTTSQRWATMLPAQLDVLRLLAWPLDLASDYSQQTIPIRTAWSALAGLGFVAMGAFVALGLACARRVPAVAFGILIAAGSYAPTSNFFFTSGVVLAERNLYLAVLAPALGFGWVVVHTRPREYHRVVVAALGLTLIIFMVRTWTRTPFWKTPQTTIIEDAGDHPENYRARLHLADLLATSGDTARALAEYLAADALAERDPFLGLFIVNSAISLKRYDQAINAARRSYQLAPDDFRPARWLVQAQITAGRRDSAVQVALHAAIDHPASLPYADTYLLALESSGAPPISRLLAAAKVDWLAGHLVQSSARLDSVAALRAREERPEPSCSEIEAARPAVGLLHPVIRVPPCVFP